YLDIHDLPVDVRAAVERLAGNETMEPFWKQLPAQLEGRAGEIISWTTHAYIEAISLLPPRVAQRQLIDKFLTDHGPTTDPILSRKFGCLLEKFYPTTYGMIAEYARLLEQGLNIIPSVGYEHWAEAWPGNPELTLDQLCSLVASIAACCDRLVF